MTPKMTKFEMKALLMKAFIAAEKATTEYLIRYPDNWYPCGFAWVVLPGNAPITNVLKVSFEEQKRGNKGYPKGWHIWNPSGHGTQSMDAKMAGARAFADTLTKAGFDCYADCRMD